MKKILIIANLYHASPRVPNLVKYMREFGWEVTILTAPVEKRFFLEKVKIVETEDYNRVFDFWRRYLKKRGFSVAEGNLLNQVKERESSGFKIFLINFVFKLYKTIFAYPDEEKEWEELAVKTGRGLLENEKFDVIMSSSSPVIAHIIAKRLKAEFRISWIADFRDLWTQNHDYPYCFLRKKLEKKLEKKTISSADALITVSSPLKDKLKKVHKGKEVYVITHGFDPEKINVPADLLDEKFTITYTGQIYEKKKDPTKVLTAIKQLITDEEVDPGEVCLNFYGPLRDWLRKEINKLGLQGVVGQKGAIPREDALKKQRKSQLLLLLKWEVPEEKGVYTGKLFEYLAARRPVLAVGGSKDVVSDLLKETKVGREALNVKETKNCLQSFYSEYKKRGEVSFKGDLKEINKYSAKNIAQKFSEVLNNYS